MMCCRIIYCHFCNVLTHALVDFGWAQPTLIHERAIPLALDGMVLLARARTGSGKASGYAVPVIQRLLASNCFYIIDITSLETF